MKIKKQTNAEIKKSMKMDSILSIGYGVVGILSAGAYLITKISAWFFIGFFFIIINMLIFMQYQNNKIILEIRSQNKPEEVKK